MIERDIEELAALVQRSRMAVVFTGAGISTECGIPDFRSPGGFWTRHRPIEFADFLRSEEIRLEAWQRFLAIRAQFGDVEPGRGHRAVAELVHQGHVRSIVTQNIDELHAKSGVPEDRIIAIHGTSSHALCLSCGKRHELSWVKSEIAATGRPPYCLCSGIVKAATISFGQPMPEQAMADAKAATLKADLFLAAGSSLQVFPAASLPVMAKHNRIPLVILNRESTGLDDLADLVIHADIGDVLTAVCAKIRESVTD